MKKNILLLFLSLFSTAVFAQKIADQPKIVVIMVVDQMRADYLDRYNHLFGEKGFKRLQQEGRNYKNTYYNFFPTYTAAGHASISTGTTPAGNGIVGNEWYDRLLNANTYCTADPGVNGVGTTSPAGKMSPSRLVSTTIGDELRLATNYRSKVIGVALKDRSAILTAGHNTSGVYWFDETNGNFISSSYYTKSLPDWLDRFNALNLAKKYLNSKWESSRPIVDYLAVSTADDVPYEGKFKGEAAPVFPHDIPFIAKNYDLGLIRSTPAGNTLTAELAKAAIMGEDLGKGENTDLLCVSFSSTDYIGHQFGPRSVEVADMYVKLDSDIAGFLDFMDKRFGRNNYLLCLTADHAAADNPTYLQDHQLPAGYIDPNLKDSLNNYLFQKLTIKPVKAFQNLQFYFDESLITAKGVSLQQISDLAKRYLRTKSYINSVFTNDQIAVSGDASDAMVKLRNGFYYNRCGDLTVVLNPGYLELGAAKTGTTHGSIYNYDSRVPLLWFGAKVRPGIDRQLVHVTDIAPTIAALLNIQPPNASTGVIIPAIAGGN